MSMSVAEMESQIESVVEDHGEFAGWHIFPRESFNRHVGPFYHRIESNAVICAFRPSQKNCNGNDMIHGGSLLSFADFSMYVRAQSHYGTRNVVTISMASEFLGIAQPADLIESRTEVVSAGGSLVVLRGIMTSAQKPVLNYSGTFKRLSARER